MSKLFVPHRPLHAEVAVELFDGLTGRKVDESVGENYITPAGLEHNRWKVRNDYMASMPGAGNVDVEPINPFSEVWLSDSAASIDSGSSLPEGVVVAWANKTPYVGSDVFRGSPNSGECNADTARAVWVFDWPTTAGNGTIRSVGWRPTVGGRHFSGVLTDQLHAFGTYPAPLSGTMLTGGGLCVLPDGSLYAPPYSSDNTYRGISFPPDNPGARSYFGPRGGEIGGLGTNQTIGGCCVDSTHMYMTRNAWAGGQPTIRKFEIPTEPIGTVTGASNISVTGYSNLNSVTFDGTMLWVSDQVADKVIRIDKSSGAIDREFSAVDPIGVGYWAARNTLLVMSLSMGLCEYDLNGVLLTAYAFTANPYSVGIVVTSDGRLRWLQDSISSGIRYRTLIPTVGSRVLLPSPVTKTSLQTMKLTYTFTYT